MYYNTWQSTNSSDQETSQDKPRGKSFLLNVKYVSIYKINFAYIQVIWRISMIFLFYLICLGCGNNQASDEVDEHIDKWNGGLQMSYPMHPLRNGP